MGNDKPLNWTVSLVSLFRPGKRIVVTMTTESTAMGGRTKEGISNHPVEAGMFHQSHIMNCLLAHGMSISLGRR